MTRLETKVPQNKLRCILSLYLSRMVILQFCLKCMGYRVYLIMYNRLGWQAIFRKCAKNVSMNLNSKIICNTLLYLLYFYSTDIILYACYHGLFNECQHVNKQEHVFRIHALMSTQPLSLELILVLLCRQPQHSVQSGTSMRVIVGSNPAQTEMESTVVRS